jgi:hypothetical protein
MMLLRMRRWLAALQEVILLLFFLAIVRTLWIVLFHFELFFGSKRRQMPDEVNQFPTGIGVAVFGSGAAERGHASEAHSIFDDPENIAVAKILRSAYAKIGRLGLEAAADHGVSTPIVGMTNGAVIGEVQSRFALHLRRVRDWVFLVVRGGRSGHFARDAGDGGFERARLSLCA